MEKTIKSELLFLMRAINFAAHKHRKQKRKGSLGIPYINHPIEVLSMLTEKIEDPSFPMLIAAVLHDTIEDTDATAEEIDNKFGTAVKNIVLEVTDDKSLSRSERKKMQIEKVTSLSYEAKCIKIADKACNINDILYTRIKWSRKRKIDYVQWACKVVDPIRDTHKGLTEMFDQVVKKAEELLDFTV